MIHEVNKIIMKNILLVFPKDSEALFNKNSDRTFGGASVQMYNIAKELSNYTSIKTYSLIPKYDFIDFDDVSKFILIPGYDESDNILFKFLKFIKIVITIKPVAILQRGLTTESCILAVLCKLINIKFIFMFAHDVEVQGLRQSNRTKVIAFPLLIKFAYKLITQNIYQNKTIFQKYGRRNVILYSGFEIPQKQKNKKLCKNILWVARCDDWKQPELFMKLAKINKNLYFKMICPVGANIEYYNKIKYEASTIKNLEFIPFVSYFEINKYFEEAYIFVNTSKYEGFPQTFIQAAISKTPILSLNVNPENIFTKHNIGIYCKGDFNILNHELQKLVTHSDCYNKLAKNAFSYALKNHNIKINVSKLLSIIR